MEPPHTGCSGEACWEAQVVHIHVSGGMLTSMHGSDIGGCRPQPARNTPGWEDIVLQEAKHM